MTASKSIPTAGPDFEHLLAQDVVIEATTTPARTGAQSVEPDHSPRAPQAGAAPAAPDTAGVGTPARAATGVVK